MKIACHFYLFEVGAEAYSSPISSSSSDAFDGITYYHVSITKGTVEEGDKGVTPATDSDGNAPGKVTTEPGTEGTASNDFTNRKIEYSLKLDDDGNPYIDVAITTTSKSATFMTKEAQWSGFTLASDTTLSGKFVTTGRTAYSNSSNYSTVTTIPAYADINKTGDCETDRGFSHATQYATFDNYFKTGESASQDNNVYYWFDIGYFDSSSSDNTKDTDAANSIKTGNLSVQLSSGLVAVLPVSGGAI